MVSIGLADPALANGKISVRQKYLQLAREVHGSAQTHQEHAGHAGVADKAIGKKERDEELQAGQSHLSACQDQGTDPSGNC